MIATIDARVDGAPDPGSLGTLEIKNVSSYVGQRWNEGQPPVEFTVQLQHQMLVTGDQWGSIAALIGGVFFVWCDIPRDDEFCELLVQDVQNFVKRVHDRRPPPPDDKQITTDFLQKLYAIEAPKRIELPIDLVDT